jgi:hypothetical protein
VQEPQTQTTTRREALQALAEGYAHRLNPDASFTEISSPGILEQAFKSWQGAHRGAGLAPPQKGSETPSWDQPEVPSRARASRGIYLYDFSRPADLETLAEALLRGEGRLNGPNHLAAAAVLAERARREDQLSGETRTQAAVIEQRVAELLERAGRPGDAYEIHMSAFHAFSADPERTESARECMEAAVRLRGDLGHVEMSTSEVARIQGALHTTAALAMEEDRRFRKSIDFFENGVAGNGVNRPTFKSMKDLLKELREHRKANELPSAEIVSREINERLSVQGTSSFSVRHQTILADLVEKRTDPLLRDPLLRERLSEEQRDELKADRRLAERLRESAFHASIQVFGHSDPRTIKAATSYVTLLRHSGAYEKSAKVARYARRRANLGIGELIQSMWPGRGSQRPVSGGQFNTAIGALDISAQFTRMRLNAAGTDQEAPRTAESGQAPPTLYTNTGRVLGPAIGKARHGGVRRGVAGRNATAKDPRARRAGR